jgi:hypothetical protein
VRMMTLATQPMTAPAMIHTMKLIMFVSRLTGAERRTFVVPVACADHEFTRLPPSTNHIHRPGGPTLHHPREARMRRPTTPGDGCRRCPQARPPMVRADLKNAPEHQAQFSAMI